MSLAVAQTQIISIVEAVTPVRISRGLPPKFKHYPKATRQALPDSRGFFFENGPRVLNDWMGALSVAHILKEQSLVVSYRRDTDKLALELAIDEDADVIMRALLNPSLWNRPTSTIVAIDAGDALVTSVVEEEDNVLAVMTFKLEVEP